MALHKARTRYLPAGFQWCPGCTWHRQRWCPGRSRAPQPHQTQVPGSVRSCSRSHRLSERAKVVPSQTPVTPSALPGIPEGRPEPDKIGPAQALTKMQSSRSDHTGRVIPQESSSQVQGPVAQVFPGHQTGAGALGTWAILCSILPEEPLELGCQDQWSHCGSRMINSSNYAPCRAVSAVPSLAQLTAPQGSAGLTCSGGGSQGTHRPQPTVPPGGQSPHTAACGAPVGEPMPSPRPWHPARPAPILLPCASRLPAASPVWRREEPRLAALAAICTSRLWGRVAAPAPRSPGPWGSRAGWWQKAGERLADPRDALWEKPL